MNTIKASLVASCICAIFMVTQANAESMTDNIKQSVDETSKNIATSLDNGVEKISTYSSDSAITAKIKKAFLSDSSLPSQDISVSTTNGTVTLTGFVPNEHYRTLAIELATNVAGVKCVNDNLAVQAQGKDDNQAVNSYIDDASITADIKAKLFVADNIPSSDISVVTANGVVQLTGSVNNTAQSVAAETLIKQVKGVKAVENHLTITN